MLIDIVFSPVIAFLIIVAPWRFLAFIYRALTYQYKEDTPISTQIRINRIQLVDELKKGASDLFSLIKAFVIIGTFIRLPFFMLVLLRNVFPNSWATKSFFGHKNSKVNPEKRYSLKQVIDIAFTEAIVDIPYLVGGLIGCAIAPWRLIYMFYVHFAYQVKRIPANPTLDMPVTEFTGRYNIVTIFWKAIRYDYPCILNQIVIILAIYRVPVLLWIYITAPFKLGKYRRGVTYRKIFSYFVGS